jgi:cytochrome c biogenesis protein CcmG, thiol:disulfide interchange protein DsbE
MVFLPFGTNIAVIPGTFKLNDMKKAFLTLLAITAITFAGPAQEKQTGSGKPLPKVDIKDVEGNPFNTSAINNNGKPIIISFWATWCKPCIKELTTIADVYDEWVTETGVKLIAVSIDDPRSTNQVRPLANGKNWEYEVLLDPNGDFKRAMNVGPIPHTFLLDSNRNIVWQHTSFSEGAELELIDLVRKLNKGESLK